MKISNFIQLTICISLVFLTSTLAFGQSRIDFQKLQDTTHYGRNSEVGKYIDIRGFKMYYETYGKGQPVLMIHGNGGSIASFALQIPYFSKKYKVIVADSRSQGKSIDTKDSLSYPMMADDYNALLDSLHIDSCYVIGWSDGGINGLLLAIIHPNKVKKLAITGANLRPDTTAVDPFIRKWALHLNDTLNKMKPTPKIKHWRKLAHLLSYEPHIPLSKLYTIKCPVLVIGGDHDLIRPKHTLQIFNNIPKAYLWILPNSGHSILVYYKDIFNKIVSHFFSHPYRKISGLDKFK